MPFRGYQASCLLGARVMTVAIKRPCSPLGRLTVYRTHLILPESVPTSHIFKQLLSSDTFNMPYRGCVQALLDVSPTQRCRHCAYHSNIISPAELLSLAVGPSSDGLVHVDTIIGQEVAQVRSRWGFENDFCIPLLLDGHSNFRWRIFRACIFVKHEKQRIQPEYNETQGHEGRSRKTTTLQGISFSFQT